ncbi:MAG: sodium:solute symporter, partial [Bacteroidales bacterium]|nr:sodium:solute symporter [Bacteroidales bacterium]
MTHEFPLAVFLGVLIIYILFLFVVSRITSRRAEGNAYYKGDRKAPWPVVAYGMVGATITGVTYVSVPGNVLVQNFYYIPMVAGFVVGYIIVATMLIPLYYRLNLTSIYSYLEERFGAASHMTGAVAFMVSRITGSGVRLFMVILVLVSFLPPFVGGSNLLTFLFCTVVFITLVYLYTYRGGVKTIIWTDVIQTTVTLSAVVLTVFSICREMGWNFGGMLSGVMTARNPETGVRYTTIFDWDWNHATNAVKQFIS